MAKRKPINQKMTQAAVVAHIAEQTGVTKADVKGVLSALSDVATRHLIKGGCGEFVVPGMAVKLKAVSKPAQKARKGRNPFTGEEIMIKAKPATKSVRARVLKTMKDAVAG